MIKEKTIKEYSISVNDFAAEYGFPVQALKNLHFNKYTDYFDAKGLFIGITCDADGLFWIPEVCSIPLDVCNSRELAQERAVEECFKMLEQMKVYALK